MLRPVLHDVNQLADHIGSITSEPSAPSQKHFGRRVPGLKEATLPIGFRLLPL